MTRRQLVERIECWRRLLMPEWRVALLDGEPDSVRSYHSHGDDDWVACAQGDVTITEARLHVKEDVLGYEPQQIDRIIVHELIHPLLDRVLDHAELLREHVPPPLWEAFQRARMGDEEEFVNRIAHVIATHGEHGESPYGTHAVPSTDK